MSLTELGSGKFEFSVCLIYPALFIFKLDIANSIFFKIHCSIHVDKLGNGVILRVCLVSGIPDWQLDMSGNSGSDFDHVPLAFQMLCLIHIILKILNTSLYEQPLFAF